MYERSNYRPWNDGAAQLYTIIDLFVTLASLQPHQAELIILGGADMGRVSSGLNSMPQVLSQTSGHVHTLCMKQNYIFSADAIAAGDHSIASDDTSTFIAVPANHL